ncbi:MAG: NUDIX hydrolase [Gammaproteobacteria bacterium]
MQWKPYVTVAAVVRRDDRFLLVEEEADGQVVFNQPAGHLEQNEDLIQAVKREVLEETASEFEPENIVGIYLYPNPYADITYLRFCFSGNCTQQHPGRPLDHGILRAVWLSRAEIEAQGNKMRSPMVMRCIDDFLSGKSFPLELINHYLPGSTAAYAT